MGNKPVAWYKKNSNDYLIENIGQPSFQIEEFIDAGYIPLYTQEQLEEARKLGMQQERALWNLSTSTQEIMDTHPVKELTDEVKDALMDTLSGWKYIRQCHGDLYGVGWDRVQDKLEAILRKAQE